MTSEAANGVLLPYMLLVVLFRQIFFIKKMAAKMCTIPNTRFHIYHKDSTCHHHYHHHHHYHQHHGIVVVKSKQAPMAMAFNPKMKKNKTMQKDNEFNPRQGECQYMPSLSYRSKAITTQKFIPIWLPVLEKTRG